MGPPNSRHGFLGQSGSMSSVSSFASKLPPTGSLCFHKCLSIWEGGGALRSHVLQLAFTGVCLSRGKGEGCLSSQSHVLSRGHGSMGYGWQVGGMHSTGILSCYCLQTKRSTSGCYASHWNAFLLVF